MGRFYHILLRIHGTRQNWNRHLTGSAPKQEQARTGFSKISTYGAFRRGSCCDFELISSSLYSSPYKEERREAKIHWKRSETPPNAIKTQVMQTTEQVNRFYIFSLILKYLNDRYIRTYSHTNSYNNAVTQCHVDGSQRSLEYLCVNATLMVAWILAPRPDNKFCSLASLSQTTNIPNLFCRPIHMQKSIQDYLEVAQLRM